jgi:hypothetical protein
MLPPHLAEQSCFYRSDVGHRAAVALCGGMVRLYMITGLIRLMNSPFSAKLSA